MEDKLYTIKLTEDEIKRLYQILASTFFEHYYQIRDDKIFFDLNDKVKEMLGVKNEG